MSPVEMQEYAKSRGVKHKPEWAARPLIFLDIDGVLVNRRSLKERSGLRAIADPKCVYALNWLTTRVKASIVISSAWRFCGTEEMRLILNHWGVHAPVWGATPDLSQRGGSSPVVEQRGLEIETYLRANALPTTPFVILDDESDMGALKPWLVKTKFEEGLTEDDAFKAVEILTSGRGLRALWEGGRDGK